MFPSDEPKNRIFFFKKKGRTFLKVGGAMKSPINFLNVVLGVQDINRDH